MVNKTKSKSIKSKTTKSKSKSVKPKSNSTKLQKKSVEPLNKVGNSRLSLLTKTAIGGLGGLAAFGAGYILKEELIPYLKENYSIHQIIKNKKWKQYNEEDYEELYSEFPDLTFKKYLSQHYYRIRDNYNNDKQAIYQYNKDPKNTNKILRMNDYIKNKNFDHKRLPNRKKYSII
jgi:hypothetical protein